MRSTGILYASSLVGIAAATSLRQIKSSPTLPGRDIGVAKVSSFDYAAVTPLYPIGEKMITAGGAQYPQVYHSVLQFPLGLNNFNVIPPSHNRLQKRSPVSLERMIDLNKVPNHVEKVDAQEKKGGSSQGTSKQVPDPVIHDAVHYRRKGDLLQEKIDQNGHSDADHEKLEWIRAKETALRANDPYFTSLVRKGYNDKVNGAITKLKSGQGDQREMSKVLTWNNKKPLWKERYAVLDKDWKEKMRVGAAETWNSDAEKEIKHYFANEYHPRKASIRQQRLQQKQSEHHVPAPVKIHDPVDDYILQKRAPAVEIHSATHYLKKLDALTNSGKPFDDVAARKWRDNYDKSNGMSYNKPGNSLKVINNYTTKIEKAKAMLEDGKGDAKGLNDKIGTWSDKKLLWERRHADLLKQKQLGGSLGADSKAQKEVDDYRKSTYRAEKRGLKEVEEGQHHQEKQYVIQSPVYYYLKSDKHLEGSAKHNHNLLKAAGARFNNPFASGDVVKSYARKIKETNGKLSDGQVHSTTLTRKMEDWQKIKVPEWEQRKERLTEEKKLKGKDYWKDEKMEELVKEYKREKKIREEAQSSTSEERLQKRGVIKESSYYSQKASRYPAGSQKYEDNHRKAEASRSNDPSLSRGMAGHYEEKIHDATNKLESRHGDMTRLFKKLDKWRNKSVPQWSQKAQQAEDAMKTAKHSLNDDGEGSRRNKKSRGSIDTSMSEMYLKKRALIHDVQQTAAGTFTGMNEEVEKPIQEWHKKYKERRQQHKEEQESERRGHHLQKRGVIHEPTYHYAKKDARWLQAEDGVKSMDKDTRRKWSEDFDKAVGAKYNVPEYSKKVVDKYHVKIADGETKLDSSEGEEKVHLIKKLKEWKEEKLPAWEARHSMLVMKEKADRAADTFVNTDPDVKKKVSEYHANFMKNLRFDRSQKRSSKRARTSEDFDHRLEKRGAIHDVPHYLNKADAKTAGVNQDGLHSEDARKWSENLVKATALRYNKPAYSDAVVRVYGKKIEAAQEKLERGEGDAALHKEKIKSWDGKTTAWKGRLEELDNQQRLGTWTLQNPEVEAQVEKFEKDRRARMVSEVDKKKSKGENAQKTDLSSKNFQSQFSKRTIDAVKYMKKGEEIAARPVHTQEEQVEKTRKWMENLTKTQGARYNTPVETIAVVNMYKAKMRRGQYQWDTRQGDLKVVRRKMKNWKKKLPVWKLRQRQLMQDWQNKSEKGEFRPRDPKIEKAIEEYKARVEERKKGRGGKRHQIARKSEQGLK